MLATDQLGLILEIMPFFNGTYFIHVVTLVNLKKKMSVVDSMSVWVKSLQMTQTASDTSEICSIFTRLIAREDFIVVCFQMSSVSHLISLIHLTVSTYSDRYCSFKIHLERIQSNKRSTVSTLERTVRWDAVWLCGLVWEP